MAVVWRLDRRVGFRSGSAREVVWLQIAGICSQT